MAKGSYIAVTEFRKKLEENGYIPICDDEMVGGAHQYFYLSKYGIAVRVVANGAGVTKVETVESCTCKATEE